MAEWFGYIGALGLGAVLADIVRGLINWFMHKRQWNDEIKKTVILKKLQVSEDVMTCLQSVVDELMQLKLICQVEKDIPANYLEWCQNLKEHIKSLYPGVQTKLNRLGTYYDFSSLIKKHEIHRVMEGFNKHVSELSIYSQHVLTPEGAAKPVRIITGGAGEIEQIMAHVIEDVDAIIAYAEDIQAVIRNDIGQYCK